MKKIKFICKNCEKEISVREDMLNRTCEESILCFYEYKEDIGCLVCGSFEKPWIMAYEEKE